MAGKAQYDNQSEKRRKNPSNVCNGTGLIATEITNEMAKYTRVPSARLGWKVVDLGANEVEWSYDSVIEIVFDAICMQNL